MQNGKTKKQIKRLCKVGKLSVYMHTQGNLRQYSVKDGLVVVLHKVSFNRLPESVKEATAKAVHAL